MKTLFYYKSRHGTTRQFITWLHESIDSDAYSTGELLPRDLGIYDTVVLAAPIYMGKIRGSSALAALWPRIKDKRVLLVTVSASPDDPEMSQWLESSLPADMVARVDHISLEGHVLRSFIPIVGPLLRALTKKDPALSGPAELSRATIEPVIEALT